MTLPTLASVPEGLHDRVDALGAADVKAIEGYLFHLRKWDLAVGKAVQKPRLLSHPETRDTAARHAGGFVPTGEDVARRGEARCRMQWAFKLVDKVFNAYQTKQKDDLATLLTQVSRRVAQIYSALHPGEDFAAVSIEPWTAKGVELAIEFYGSHQKPPHGVLSESHLTRWRLRCSWRWRNTSTRSSGSSCWTM